MAAYYGGKRNGRGIRNIYTVIRFSYFLLALLSFEAGAATKYATVTGAGAGDGSGSAITVFPNSPGGGVGTYTVELNITSTGGAWKVTTGAGVAVIAIWRFEP